MAFLKQLLVLIMVAMLFSGSAMAEEGIQADLNILTDEYILADEENGIWRYEKQGLKINIERRHDPSIGLIWYEAELWCSPEENVFSMVTNPDKPGASFKSPLYITKTNKYVFAINDDFFGDRTYNKETVGVVIRNGVLLYKDTYRKSGNWLPNLDTVAFFADGHIEVNDCAEVTAEEFMEKGAVDVLSFGPVLIRDGVINPILETQFRPTEPRVALGMVEPFHYVVVVTEGRHSLSKGCNCLWLAEKLKEMGAVQAINLDGGQTSALMFMGEKINKTGKSGHSTVVRNLSGMLAVGISDQVPDYK